MPQFPQRLSLDLADALARHRELVPNLFERLVVVHADAEAHAHDALFARRQRGERQRGGFAQVRLDRGVDRQDRVLVLDEIAKMGILLVADGRLQRQRLLGDLEHLAHLPERRSAGFRTGPRSWPRDRPRCAWRWRSRPRATTARPSPFRADTCVPDRRSARPAPWPRSWPAPRGRPRPARPRHRFLPRPLPPAALPSRRAGPPPP